MQFNFENHKCYCHTIFVCKGGWFGPRQERKTYKSNKIGKNKNDRGAPSKLYD